MGSVILLDYLSFCHHVICYSDLGTIFWPKLMPTESGLSLKMLCLGCYYGLD